MSKGVFSKKVDNDGWSTVACAESSSRVEQKIKIKLGFS